MRLGEKTKREVEKKRRYGCGENRLWEESRSQ